MAFQFQAIFQLILALILGALIGLEREYKRKGAGLQTYSLIALGTCLFTKLSFTFFNSFSDKAGLSFDPSRVIQAIAIGIGFIGAGIIIYRKPKVEGLTTAAGLWVVSAIGIAVGFELYALAIVSTLLVIAILAGLGLLEKKIFPDRAKNV